MMDCPLLVSVVLGAGGVFKISLPARVGVARTGFARRPAVGLQLALPESASRTRAEAAVWKGRSPDGAAGRWPVPGSPVSARRSRPRPALTRASGPGGAGAGLALAKRDEIACVAWRSGSAARCARSASLDRGAPADGEAGAAEDRPGVRPARRHVDEVHARWRSGRQRRNSRSHRPAGSTPPAAPRCQRLRMAIGIPVRPALETECVQLAASAAQACAAPSPANSRRVGRRRRVAIGRADAEQRQHRMRARRATGNRLPAREFSMAGQVAGAASSSRSSRASGDLRRLRRAAAPSACRHSDSSRRSCRCSAPSTTASVAASKQRLQRLQAIARHRVAQVRVIEHDQVVLAAPTPRSGATRILPAAAASSADRSPCVTRRARPPSPAPHSRADGPR